MAGGRFRSHNQREPPVILVRVRSGSAGAVTTVLGIGQPARFRNSGLTTSRIRMRSVVRQSSPPNYISGAKRLQKNLVSAAFLKRGFSGARKFCVAPSTRRIAKRICPGNTANYPPRKFIFFMLTRMNAVSYAAHPPRILPGESDHFSSNREYSS